ncbi:hypothetical protein BH11MYX1_BH11MYX1_07220 [soil metagenome]
MIEVMIAMVLTAVAIMCIIALYVTQTKASNFSRHSTEAAMLAQDKIERMRAGSGIASAWPAEPNINERGSGAGIYTRNATMTLTSNYWDIRVVVQWSDDGQPHTITQYARRGP